MAALLTSALCATSAAVPQVSTGEGFQVAGVVDIDSYCGTFPATYTYLDGSTLAFDGTNIRYQTADGILLRDYGGIGMQTFASFLEVSPDGAMAYFGESSTGAIRSLDLATGEFRVLATLPFNYDLAFDVVPGLAFSAASAFGSATNSVFLIDLVSGQTSQVADIGGYSGPLEVDEFGNLYVAALPGSFPLPAGGTDVYRFDAAQVTSGAILTDEVDGFLFSGGFNGMSSAAYDTTTNSLVVIETNAGPTGSGSIVWKLDANGQRESAVAAVGGYASGCQSFNAGTGSFLAEYQSPATAVRFGYRQCNTTGEWNIWTATPQRPSALFFAPDPGPGGAATIMVINAPTGGFVSLWMARSGSILPAETFVSIGAPYPVGLAANLNSFVRRLPAMPVDATGRARVDYNQDPSIAGAILFQWVVFDSSMQPVGTSTHALN